MSRGKKKTKSTDQLLVSIGKFDTRDPIVREIYSNVNLADARSIDLQDYSPSGGTPLNDAVLHFGGQLDSAYKDNPSALHVGLLADESGSMLNLRKDVIEGFNAFLDSVKADKSEGGEPGVIMVIMTDGEENSSREDPSGDGVKEFVKQKEDEGWNFFFLGANQDSWQTGARFGAGANTVTLDYAATSQGTRSALRSTSNLINTRKSEGTTSSNFAVLASDEAGVKNYLDKEDDSEDVS